MIHLNPVVTFHSPMMNQTPGCMSLLLKANCKPSFLISISECIFLSLFTDTQALLWEHLKLQISPLLLRTLHPLTTHLTRSLLPSLQLGQVDPDLHHLQSPHRPPLSPFQTPSLPPVQKVFSKTPCLPLSLLLWSPLHPYLLPKTLPLLIHPLQAPHFLLHYPQNCYRPLTLPRHPAVLSC